MIGHATLAMRVAVGYVERHLLQDEQILYKTRLHWILLLRPSVLMMLGLAIMAFSWWADGLSARWAAALTALSYLGGAATVAGLLWALLN